MNDTEKVVSLKEAKKEVGVAITRLALMHLAYSKTLIEEFGDKHGEEIVIGETINSKAIGNCF